MLYTSTRNSSVQVSSAAAISQGISSDGGLFVPVTIPVLTEEDMKSLDCYDYINRAFLILSKFLTDYSEKELYECVASAYQDDKFDNNDPAPLRKLSEGEYMLELWHGPTCAFKDVALQLLPHLLTVAVKKEHPGKKIVILVATSGDTGKASLEGFKDVPNTEIMVFYPQNGVSPMQKRQMVTQEGNNVGVCAIEGNFDDAQTGVKKIFTDPSIHELLEKNGKMFSSANSINWGRLVPQIVYYVSAYCDLVNDGAIAMGDPFNVVVPTGNFGNILAAYYARQMGVPIAKLICASNENKVLTDFIQTGIYNRNRDFYTTASPSMDILISSNLERLLYELSGKDDRQVTAWMQELNTAGHYKVGSEMLEKIQSLFYAGYCDDDDTKATIARLFKEKDYLCDTHTAVAVNVYRQYVEETGDHTCTVIASTASPFKFVSSVLEAVQGGTNAGSEYEMVTELNIVTGEHIPEPLLDIMSKQSRFNDVCTKETMRDYVVSALNL